MFFGFSMMSFWVAKCLVDARIERDQPRALQHPETLGLVGRVGVQRDGGAIRNLVDRGVLVAPESEAPAEYRSRGRLAEVGVRLEHLTQPELVLVDRGRDLALAHGAVDGVAVGEPGERDRDAVARRHLVGDELHEGLLRGVALRRGDQQGGAGNQVRRLGGVHQRDHHGCGDGDERERSAHHPGPATLGAKLEAVLGGGRRAGGGVDLLCHDGVLLKEWCAGGCVTRAVVTRIAVRACGVVKRTAVSPSFCTVATSATSRMIVAIITPWSNRWYP